RARIEQSAERISGFGPFRSDPLFAPTPVISSVVRLHGSNYFLRAESFDLTWAQVLGVLDPKAAVACAVLFGDLLVDFENLKVSFVADGMDHHLQAAAIGAQDAFEHNPFR